MLRRLAALLTSVALIAVALAASPCASRAACRMVAAQQMDCCANTPGIGTPRCCPEQKQLAHRTTPATPDRPLHGLRTILVASALPVVLVLAAPLRPALARGIDPGAAPPGGTLISQHTSLLL